MTAQDVGRDGSIRLLAGPPVLSSELLEAREIPSAHLTFGSRPLVHQLVQILGKNGPDGMKSVVATQPFALQTFESIFPDDDWIQSRS